MAASLLNKAVDLGFAVVMFRLLGAEGVGAYTFAGVLTTYFDIVVGWGLATLITRDVARDPAGAGRYLGNATALRLVLWLGAAGVTALLVGPLAGPLGIDAPLALAIWLLVLGLVPSLLSGVLSALFMAHERMDLPAGVTVFSTISKVVLGLAALLLGWGYVGLAAVSIVTNVATLVLLAVLYGVLIGLAAPERRSALRLAAARHVVPADGERPAESTVLQDRRAAAEAAGRRPRARLVLDGVQADRRAPGDPGELRAGAVPAARAVRAAGPRGSWPTPARRA